MLSIVLGAMPAMYGCEVVREYLYSPKIEVKCEVLRKQCHFRNFGDPGADCVIVEVFHMESGRVMRSQEVCSGHIERDEPVTIPVQFDDVDPLRICMGENMEENFVKQCTVSVVEVDK